MGIKIGLTGKMRSGKDTIGKFLNDEYGFKAFAFAEGIKLVCGALSLESSNGKPRALYQGVGQDLRKYDPDIWVKYTLGQINRFCSDTDSIVITDVRQPNEVEALRAAGFTIIKINADDGLRIQRMREAGDDFKLGDLDHETERTLENLDVDLIIENNRTLPDLYNTVTEVILKMFDIDDPLLCYDEGSF